MHASGGVLRRGDDATAGISSSWRLEGMMATFSIFDRGRELVTFGYEPSHWLLNIAADPTPFVEPDDF